MEPEIVDTPAVVDAPVVDTPVATADAAPATGTVESPITDAPPVKTETVAAVETVAPEVVPEPPAFPSSDEFGWDDWKLDNLDALPEPVRPWAAGVLGKQQTYLGDVQRSAEHYRSLYETLSFGDDDPRFADTVKELEAAKTAMSEHEAQVEAYKAQLTSQAEAHVEEEYRWFTARHGEALAAQPELEAAMVDVYSFGDNPEDEAKVQFTLEEAFKIAEKGEKSIGLAKELSKEGVPVNRIFELLDLRGQVTDASSTDSTVKAKPNPAVGLVTGASPPRAPKPPPTSTAPKSPREARLSAARKAIERAASN